MEKLLNVGCGFKLSNVGNWTNIDMGTHSSANVIRSNLLDGFPCENNDFDVVYHSQVLEHIPRDKARFFMAECYRVLKPGGILRVVVPDLEDIAKTYLENLNLCRSNLTDESLVRYNWILMEMFDQSARNYPGGSMKHFLEQLEPHQAIYIEDRIGRIGNSIINSKTAEKPPNISVTNSKNTLRAAARTFIELIYPRMKEKRQRKLAQAELEMIGGFRVGGEIHYWMYDLFGLTHLLSEIGFKSITKMGPDSSSIPQWHTYQLDIIDGHVCDPKSLFVESVK